jgi:glycosyltransferase involved in cell wall biosynthesis
MIPEIITHGKNGLLVDPQDADALHRYTTELLQNTEKATNLGLAARETIMEMFGLKRFIDDWNNLFEKVANGTATYEQERN